MPGPVAIVDDEEAIRESVAFAVRREGYTVDLYPDGGATALREALAATIDADPTQIVCGAGSDEILQLLTRAYAGPGDEVLYSQHGFLVYPIAAQSVGAKPVAAPEKNLRTDVDALLAHVTPRTKICFVAEPNNPTGSYIGAAELKRLRDGLPDHVLLVVDAAKGIDEDVEAFVFFLGARDPTVTRSVFDFVVSLGF